MLSVTFCLPNLFYKHRQPSDESFCLLSFLKRAFYPAEGPFRLYASAGIGYFYTKMIVYGSTLGVPGSYDDTDMSMEFYYGAGLGYMFGKWGLGLDYRHFNLDGSFSGFNISNADVGGDVYLVGIRFTF